MSRIVVSRGDRFDVAEWSPDRTDGKIEPPPPEPPRPPPLVSPGIFAIIASLVIVGATAALLILQKPAGRAKPLPATIADVAAVHAHVTAGGADVRGTQRLAADQAVSTDVDGRGRLRLDDGTAMVLDRATKLTLTGKGIALDSGRVFVLGVLGARTEIDLGSGAVAIVSGANVGVERKDAAAKAYAANGEITVRDASGDHTVHAGETATVSGGKVTVAPERGYDDWTGGMAAPWGASGSPRRAVGELWGRPANAQPGDPGSPLTIRAHDVTAEIAGEVASTQVETTFFNAGSDAVNGDFRMAIPANAIVSRFATRRGDSVAEGHIALASRRPGGTTAQANVLEWAGEGWVRGTVLGIPAGATVTVIVRYVEWLTPVAREGGSTLVVEYRYPMVGDASPPLIGEFSATIDAGPSSPISLAAGLGARVDGSTVVIHKPDFRPTADLVVALEIDPWKSKDAVSSSGPTARIYAAPPAPEDEAGGTVVVRTETPAQAREDGVALALVVDASASIEPALFDAERALVEAVLGSLGAKDRAIVIAADQTVRTVGPQTMGPVDAERRKAVSAGLAALSTGGATDLGRALEAGADALPADAPAAMVIYIGDGWATVGDSTVDEIMARLARRPGGAPRLGAVGVGPLVNRFALAGLVRGSGPLLEIADSNDAAKTAISLVGDALQPTVAAVSIELGPEVERTYPRAPRAIVAGGTATAVGRVRGDLPKEITLRWRDAKGEHAEKRALVVVPAVDEGDVQRRWAAARVEDIALSGKGREAATDVALRSGLLTPWTGWLTGGAREYVATSLQTRVLDLAAGSEGGGFSAALGTPHGSRGTLSNVVRETEEEDTDDKDDSMKRAVAEAAQRVIEAAGNAVRACRDSRAQLRPELSGNLYANLQLDGDGHPDKVSVRGDGNMDDSALDRCVEVVIEGLSFPSSGLKVKVTVTDRLGLPPPRSTLRSRKCSPTSTLPMPLRRGIWRERIERSRGAAPDVYIEAKQSCELPTWTDRRALLEMFLLAYEDFGSRLAIANGLEVWGENDAASLLRRETVRRARSPEELHAIRRQLIGEEHYPGGKLKKEYNAAKDDAGRLAIVRRYLGIAPHDARLRRRLIALLESLGMKQELAAEVARFRRDPFADAGLLADGASALRRIGDEAESRRAFGELAERAPDDPWARAFLGDRLRNEGWFDDASRAYLVLEHLLADDPAALVRLALAHAGAGRLDIAERMLGRVAETGGRAGNGDFGELAARVAQVLLAEAGQRQGITPEDKDRIARAALELPYPGGSTLFLLRAPAGAHAITAVLQRGPKEAREEKSPEASAPGIGLYTLRIDPGDSSVATLVLKRPVELTPAAATKVRIDALVPESPGKPPRLVSTDVDLPPTGKEIKLNFSNATFSPG